MSKKRKHYQSFSDGPRFGEMENNKTSGHWWREYGARYVLPVVAALILVGGISLYYKTQPAEEVPNLALNETESQETQSPVSSDPGQNENLPENEGLILLEEETGLKTEEISSDSPKAGIVLGSDTEEKVTETSIVKKAQTGEGVTHLARRALKTHLESDSEVNLSKEQKLYVEDYLKDQVGSKQLEPGQTIEFDKDLIAEAINNAEQLTPAEIQIISQFVNQVPSL